MSHPNGKNLNSEIQKLIERIVAEDRERALQVSVFIDGELAVDAAAGIADPATGRKAGVDTLFPVFSCSKGPATTLVLRGVEKGLLNLRRPLAEYWENFGCNGKENITLAQTLSHNSALPQLPKIASPGEAANWELMCGKVAAETPLWKPGSRFFYHAVSFSWLACHPLVIADGRDFNTILRQDLMSKVGEQFYLGLPDELFGDLAVLESDPHPGVLEKKPYDPTAAMTIPSDILPLEKWMNLPVVLKGCLPASNGVGTARALAKHYAMLMEGELLDPEILDYALKPVHQTAPRPEDRGPHGLGYRIGALDDEPGTFFGHPGYGGSAAFGDRGHHVAVAVLKNRMVCTGDPEKSSANIICDRIYELLGFERKKI